MVVFCFWNVLVVIVLGMMVMVIGVKVVDGFDSFVFQLIIKNQMNVFVLGDVKIVFLFVIDVLQQCFQMFEFFMQMV